VNALRRSARLIAIAVGTLVGLTANPAQAAFDDKTAMAPVTVGTITVDAPAKPSTNGTRCTTTTWYYNYNGQVSSGTTTTLRASLSWDASTTPRVTSYVITAYGNGWSTKVTEVPATSLSVSDTFDGAYANQNITVTVTARTDYGWTAESPKSGVIKC
jgi:hypothetical protein